MRSLVLIGVLSLLLACSSSGEPTVKTLPSATCNLLAEKVPHSVVVRPPLNGKLLDHLTGFFTIRATADDIVFMKADTSSDVVEQMRTELTADSRVESFVYLDHAAAHAEFESIFADQPSISNSLTEEETPTSFKLHLHNSSQAQEVKDSLQDRAGVHEVIAIPDSTKHDRATQMLDLKRTLKELRASGVTPALLQLVTAEDRMADELSKDSNRQIVGPNGIFSEGDAERFEQLAGEVKAEVARDCRLGGS